MVAIRDPTLGEPLPDVDVGPETDGRRKVSVDAEAVGALRDQLIESLGAEIARPVLFRFGHEAGQADGRALSTHLREAGSLETVLSLYGWEALALTTAVTRIDTDAGGGFLVAGTWLDSYEAERHLRDRGPSDEPVCWALTGYASGWYSTVVGRTLVAVETACVARGDPQCEFEVRPPEALGQVGAEALRLLNRDLPARRLEQRLERQRETLRAQNAELEASGRDLRVLYASRTEFLADVSHELRTPLTLILPPLEELLRLPAGVLPDESRNQLKLAHRNALRLLKLANTVLDVTRLGAGRMQIEFRPVDLAPFLEDLAEDFAKAFKARSLIFVRDLAEGLPAVSTDPDALEKVVGNLLTNAMKFTPPEGQVTLRLRALGERQVIEVSDTGPGITTGDLPHIFERYQQVRSVGRARAEGFGLGLALVRELVTLLGGEVTVESRLGEGSRFTVVLPHRAPRAECEPAAEGATPAADDTAPAAAWGPPSALAPVPRGPREIGADHLAGTSVIEPVVTEPTDDADCRISTGRPRILLAEDNRDLCRYLVSILSRHWDVEVVHDGLSALTRAEQNPPDVVVADVMMPGLGGLTLCDRLKASPVTGDVPVVLLTARGDIEERLRGFDAGADDYILKPFASRELIARLRVQIALRSAQRELRLYATGLERLVEEQVGDIQRQNVELGRTNRELEDFLAVASHDLKSPLVSIAGFAEFITERFGTEVGPDVAIALDRIHSNIAWMQQLLGRLLSFATVRTTRAEPERLDLEALCGRIQTRMAPVIEASRAEITLEAPLTPVWGDPTRIEEALANLIENAVKYRHPSRDPRVTVSTVRCADHVEITVRDNGVGIAPEHHMKIFQPLFRLGGGFGQGAGLGLYIVRRVVEDAGGEIRVESELGNGASFHLTLPLAPDDVRPRRRRSRRGRSRT